VMESTATIEKVSCEKAYRQPRPKTTSEHSAFLILWSFEKWIVNYLQK